MITLNGVALSTAVPQTRIVDIVISPPQLEVTAPPKTLLAGSRYARRRYGTRDVTLILDLSINDATMRETARNALLAWCDHDAPVWLQIETIPGRHLVVVCTSLPDFSVAQWWLADLQIRFTALDPYFTDDTAHAGAVDTPFTVGGNGPGIVSIHQELSTALTDPRWVFDMGSVIQLSGEITGEFLDIDMDARRVDVDGTPIMSAVSLVSRFFTVLPGEHTIAGDNGAAGDIAWYERWL